MEKTSKINELNRMCIHRVCKTKRIQEFLYLKLYKIDDFKQTLKNIVYPCLQRLQRRPSQSYCMCQTQLFKLHQSIIVT